MGKESRARRRFVLIWQTSESLDEVVRRLGVPKGIASNRATRYRRRHGVPLQVFKPAGRKGVDWAELAEYAASLGTTLK